MKDAYPNLREAAVLQEAMQMMLSSRDIDSVLHQILLIVRNYFEIFSCSIYLFDSSGNELYCRAQNGYPMPEANRRIPLGRGVIGWTAQNVTSLYVPDVSAETRYLPCNADVRSEFAVPLVVRDKAIGVLDIESDEPDHFSAEMIGSLALLAGQAAVALENARLYSTERRRMRQIELINLIARSATTAIVIDDFLSTVADLLSDTFEGADVALLLFEDNKPVLHSYAGPGLSEGKRWQESQRNGLLGDALAQKCAVIVQDASGGNRTTSIATAGSELAVPLAAFTQPLGAMVIAHPEVSYFEEDDRAIAQAAADICATAIKNLRLSEELRRITNTDFLTGLNNQRFFHSTVAQEVARARRYNKQFSLVMIDLREFRSVNTALGFDGGDEVLRRTANLLKAQLRSHDVLCRYSGDRFTIVLPETDRDHIDSILAKVQETLCRIEYRVGGNVERLSAVCACVTFPKDGSTDLELVSQLQNRVVEAKHQPSGTEA